MKTSVKSHNSSHSKQGWYRLRHKEKFIMPLDEHMESTKKIKDDIYIQYKSKLELKFMQYCDINNKIDKFSLEPFAIQYVKPTDGKYHRYYIDFFIIINGIKCLIEIKPYEQTHPPIKPKKLTGKSVLNYKKQLETWYINQAKWKAAQQFVLQKGFKFIIITDKELG